MRLYRLAIVLLTGLMFQAPAQASAIKHVIVIMMENTDKTSIYDNTAEAPYLNNSLAPIAARANAFKDILPPAIPSEPHYILMEAGRTSFSDRTFTDDTGPSATNSTASHAHLAWQIMTSTQAPKPTWMTYQESIDATTGACPIVASGNYAPKHDPFVFFKDIAGNPPSQTAPRCVAHTRPYSQFATDLAKNRLANYVFITPNLCNDMHSVCGTASRITQGDTWLSTELPPMIAWANANAGVVFIVWDEGKSTTTLPFYAVGAGVKQGFVSNTAFNHRSVVKSVEEVLGLPLLATVAGAHDLSPLFNAGAFP